MELIVGCNFNWAYKHVLINSHLKIVCWRKHVNIVSKELHTHIIEGDLERDDEVTSRKQHRAKHWERGCWESTQSKVSKTKHLANY